MKTNLIAITFILLCTFNLSLAQNSGVWTTSGSGASTTWSASAGTVNIVASATNYGSGTAYTLNDFQTTDTMGCAGAYSEPTIGGNPSLSVRHTFPNTAVITFNFSSYVANPVLHLDRLGGGVVNSLTSSSLLKIITPGVTFTELSENDVHFVSTATTVVRESGQTYLSLPSECGPPTDGTASGSIRLNGVFNTVSFEISMDASGTTTTVNDRWELAFSSVKTPIPFIDFDGVDDYLSAPASFNINNLNELTIQFWVKANTALQSSGGIVGQKGVLEVVKSNSLQYSFKNQSGAGLYSKSEWLEDADTWQHITLVYNHGNIKTYYNGELEHEEVSLGATITASSANRFNIGGGIKTGLPSNYFHGWIDEVRVFDVALTETQLQQTIYQEIENNNGNVRGSIIPKDVADFDTNAKISWSNLKLYYKMGTDFTADGRVIDYSGNENHATIHNITTWQEETAPIPFETKQDGNWEDASTWLHGDVWNTASGINLPNLSTSSNVNCAIVKIKHNVYLDYANFYTPSNPTAYSQQGLAQMGLFVDAGKTLTIANDKYLKNLSYLELNGTLDLEDDSQLIQTANSDLVTSATGKILRRQEGMASPYRYNYWSSPVGALGFTSLTDNNAASNNTNNSDFSLQMLKDESGVGCFFTSGYTGNGNISTYWLYTFINGKTYWDWAQILVSTGLNPGVGYTQKGTGTAAPEQQYIFEGKPNNGTILIDVTDVGGLGSVPNVSKTEYLLGNPYASAIDVHQFIDDNVGVIDGYLQLWQHWGGTSHNLSEYEGGYAQVNKTGSIRASQFISFYGANTGLLEGTIVPTRYLPVGQGFIAEIVADGQVEFNNSQRIFIKESDANGSGDTGSVFSKSTKGKSSKRQVSKENEESTPMQKIRLEFNSVVGPETRKELLLGFSNNTSDAFDYGYDAKNTDTSNNDLNLDLEGQNMSIQAYAAITEEKAVPLNFRSSGDNTFEIRISELENIEENQAIYLHDNLTGIYFDLTADRAYGFSSEQGIFNDRFKIVFQSEQESLSTEESAVTENYIYYQNKINTLFVKKLHSNVSKLSLISMRGQVVLELADVSRERLENGLQFNNISTGTYVVCMRTETNEVMTKKIIVN